MRSNFTATAHGKCQCKDAKIIPFLLWCCGGEGVKLDWLPTSEGPQDVACVIFVFIFCFQLLSVAVSSVNWHKQDFCFLWLFHSCIQRHFPQIVFQNKLNPKWAEAIRRMWKNPSVALSKMYMCVLHWYRLKLKGCIVVCNTPFCHKMVEQARQDV